MPVRVLVASDLHFELIRSEVAGPRLIPGAADLVVLAGDIDNGLKGLRWAADVAKTIQIPVVYVAGNHEFWGHSLGLVTPLRDEAARLRAQDYPIHFLEQDATIVETQAGPVRVLGATLWSDFTLYGGAAQGQAMSHAADKMPDYRLIRTDWRPWRKLTPQVTLDICEETVKWMWNVVVHPFDGPTVIVTHTGPSFRSIDAGYSTHVLSPVFASDFEEVIRFGHVALWAHGHVHHSVDYYVGNTRVVCNPYGAAPDRLNPAFDPGFSVEV